MASAQWRGYVVNRANVYLLLAVLGATPRQRLLLVLTESLAIKGVKPLDVIKEGETVTYSDDERFDNDIMLMTGELAKMLTDVVEALGGEAKA